MKRSDNMEQILAYIDAHPDKNITVGELAALLDYSFYHFCHAFSLSLIHIFRRYQRYVYRRSYSRPHKAYCHSQNSSAFPQTPRR